MSLERVLNMSVALHCFALHRGGPMCYANQQGLYNVVQAMKKFGANPLDDASFWQPAPLLAKLAAEGKSFT